MTPVRVGVVGLRRGLSFVRHGPDAGMSLVALCDSQGEKLAQVGREHGVACYVDYDEFLGHDMDAVVLANYFHEHADLAVRALEAGKHVMSETAACLTLAEGVRLIDAVERAGLVYQLAENYPYMVFNQEMRRLYRAGRVGEFRYGEGEYVHPMSARTVNRISPGYDHWRNWLPVTYYCSHALAPIMYITDTMPQEVSGFVVPHDSADENKALTVRRMDTAGLIVATMEGGALAKLLQYDLRGEGNWVRIHGNEGLMENLRIGDVQQVRIRRERFDKHKGEPVETTYRPDFPHHHEEAERSGHGGADLFVNHDFAHAIRTGTQPYFDVYRGVAMAAVGILAYRSALQGSRSLRVPDFRDVEERARVADDDWSPDPTRRRPSDPWPSVLGEITPPDRGVTYAKAVWASG